MSQARADALSFDQVELSLGGRRILDGVSFSIPQGAFVGVLGPNGAGKTTLMRAVLGILPIAGGAIRVLGRAPARGGAGIGYVPQFRRGAAQLRLTGFDLVVGAVAGTRWGWPFASRADRIAAEAALERVGARDLARRPIVELSGGERQRVLVAQALIGNPRLLLLDEPLVSLDPAAQRHIVETVREVARAENITVLFCAHEVNPILPAVDEVLYLGNGQAAVGPVDDVINDQVLTRLYGTSIHVSRHNGRYHVMAEDAEFDHHTCCSEQAPSELAGA